MRGNFHISQPSRRKLHYITGSSDKLRERVQVNCYPIKELIDIGSDIYIMCSDQYTMLRST